MEKAVIVVIKYGVVHEATLVKNGENPEEIFLSKCREYISDFDSYSKEDIDAILDNGYDEFGTGNSVCLTWL